MRRSEHDATINTLSRRTKMALIISVLVLALIPGAVIAYDAFGDVPDSDWAHDDVSWLAHKGLTAGCGAGMYCPDANVTRREIAAFTHRTQVKLGTRYAEAFNADGSIGHSTDTLLVSTDITAPSAGGAISVTGFAHVVERTNPQVGILWAEIDNGGQCSGSGQMTFFAVWDAESLGEDSAVATGGLAVEAGSHRVDLCGWALGDRSDVLSEVEVLWIAANGDGGDFAAADATSRPSLSAAKARLSAKVTTD